MNSIKQKINRKSFFTTTAIAAAGLFLLRSFPIRFLKPENSKQTIQVKINPLAVSRKKIGVKNV